MGEEVLELFDKLIAESKANNFGKVSEIEEEIKKIKDEESSLEIEYYKALQNNQHENISCIISKRKTLNEELAKFTEALKTFESQKAQREDIEKEKKLYIYKQVLESPELEKYYTDVECEKSKIDNQINKLKEELSIATMKIKNLTDSKVSIGNEEVQILISKIREELR